MAKVRGVWRCGWALLLVAWLADAARAEPMPLAVTIRGGGSLGSFEAGALYYLTALEEKNPGLFDPRLLTGTSAGSINAVLTAVESCRPVSADPRESLFAKVWGELGIGALFDPARSRATGIFTREPLARVVAEVRRRWDEGLDARCDLVLGIPVTRVVPRRLDIVPAGGLDVVRVEERFILRIQGKGPGKPPRMTNYLAPHPAVAAPALVTNAAGEVSFDALMQVVFASSGVPVIFPPVALPFCMNGERMAALGLVLCPADQAETVELVDGGVLDNQPLRLAVTMARVGLADPGPDGRLAWRPAPDPRDLELPEALRFLVVDPSAMTWLPGGSHKKAQATSLRELLGTLLPGVLETATTAELQRVLEEAPEVRDRMGVLQADWPLMSDGLGSLFGFMERDLRAFDFALGMVEGRRLAELLVAPWAKARGGFVLPDPGPDAPEAVRRGWQPYRCALAVTRREASDACEGLDRQFLAALQSSLDRFAARCREMTADEAATLDGQGDDVRALCKDLHAGRRAPRVPGLSSEPAIAPAGLAEHDQSLWLLVRHGFAFRELAGGLVDFEDARAAVAGLVQRMLQALAKAQDEDAIVWRIAGRTVAQALAYRPPLHTFHLLAGGTWDLGWSATADDPDWSWLRAGLGLRLDGISSILQGEAERYFALGLAAQLELEPTMWSNLGVQLRLGLRVGFQLSTGDGFRGRLDAPTPGVPRSRPVTELYLSSTFLQWLRLQVGVSWYPPFEGLAGTWEVFPMLGLELDLPL